MSYQYETQFDSPNYTPNAETASVWGVSRQIREIAIHWWDDPSKNPTFEGVVAHFQDASSQVSAHYVATGTGRRVACLVSPEDNAWATDGENPYSIAIECDPRCRDEDYDVVAELIADIRSAYGDLPLVPHRQFWSTTCPGNWDLTRLDQIARTKVSHDQWGAVTNVDNSTPSNPTAPVVEGGDDDMIDQEALTILYQQFFNRDPEANAISHYVGHYSANFVIKDLKASGEYTADKQQEVTQAAQEASDLETAKQAATSAGQMNAELSTKLDTATKQIADLEVQLETVKAAPAVAPAKPKGFNITQYSKTITVIVGSIISVSSVYFSNNIWFGMIVQLLTALGVYVVPNQSKESKI